MTPHAALAELLSGRTLSEQVSEAAFEGILSGHFDQAQVAAVLALIQSRGATVDELVGAARVMRRHVTPVRCDDAAAIVIDTCGTGGAPKTFNISTAVAIVVAAASPHHTGPGPRVVVAKHGNRSRSGRGSAEVLGALGVNVDAAPDIQARCLAEAGVCFCFAIHHHPAARHASAPRKSLGFPTIFNLLGPLTNPAGASRQLIGIYRRDLVEIMARALARLGSQRAMVVHGSDGMDELTTAGRSWVGNVEAGQVRMDEVDARSLGIAPPAPNSLNAPDLDATAAMVRRVLDRAPGPCRDIVLLNAGAALVVAGASPDIRTGMTRAAEAIDSGRADATLATLARVSHAT
jgi:anthranilate phosphoribosyltransferase